MGYSRKKPNRGGGGRGGGGVEGGLRIWNFQGYQRNSMWNFQKLIKKQSSGISRGVGALFCLEFPGVKYKN